MRLSKTQLRLLILLTWELRLGTERQLARGLGLSLRALQTRTKRLQRRGYLHSWLSNCISHDLLEPLVSFQRGDDKPDFRPIAWQLRKRWLSASRNPARVIWAATAATNLVGGVGGRIRQPLQMQHDLGVAEIWSKRRAEPGLKWISEDIFRSWYVRDASTKVPDALLIDESENRVKLAIEYGGQYSTKRLEAFHRYWSSRCPYEIW